MEAESLLRPKYQQEKSIKSVKNVDKKSVGKKSLKDSFVSKKSVEKGKSQSRSKRPESVTRSRQRSNSRDSLRKSRDNRSEAG